MAWERLDLHFSGGAHCPIHLGDGEISALLDQIWRPEWTDAALVGDEDVLRLHGAEVERVLSRHARCLVRVGFPAGEATKTRATKESLEDCLLAAGLGRQACVVGLGGGISLDVAGFLAATYLRGVPWVGVPTSLLAQVDAAVGGKTGVNTPRGKNLVGAFHQPAAVVISTAVLRTLPAAEWRNGLAEVVKHAVVADAEAFAWLEAHAESVREIGGLPLPRLRRCVGIKAEIVQADEREGGRRAVLNFGHTVAHAVEAATGHAVPHGRAVARGMVAEARLASQLTGFPAADVERLRALLHRLGIHQETVPELTFDALEPFLASDKKRRDGQVRLALPSGLGAMAARGDVWTWPVPVDALRRAWDGGE